MDKMEPQKKSCSQEDTILSVKMPSIFSRIKMAKDTLSPFYYNGIRQHHLSKDTTSYEAAIKKLNTLQTCGAYLELKKQKGKSSHFELASKVEDTLKYLQRTGITLEKLNKLSVIHVSGTKGKGTTCASCESILRHNGYKTGFFSSPHLVQVRERIRINGIPLSCQQFAKYFEDIFNDIVNKKENNDDMPTYFKFMTVMALNVFIKEQVDVAILEVGLGGEYDCTNCLRNTAVVGITSLGLDHTSTLGNTISEIAWQKAGIMKPHSVAFTVPQKSSAAMQILRERAQNRNCKLYVTPSLDSYNWGSYIGFVQDNYSVHALNYSLALQLANEWMKQQSPFHEKTEENNIPEEPSSVIPIAKPFEITKKIAEGLQNYSWPGRSQIIVRDKITYFLDGAHTEESIKYCTRWFKKCSSHIENDNSSFDGITRVLIFSVLGERDSNKFLEILSGINFDYAIFTTNKLQLKPKEFNDSFDRVNNDGAEKSARANYEIWNKWVRPIEEENFMCTKTVKEALNCLNNIANKKGTCHVLVTGSLHLVGNILAVIDPELQEPVYHLPKHLKPLQDVYSGLQAIL